MKSSSGQHFLGLDHIRALAALLVVAWHFIHSTNGTPIPFGFTTSILPLSIFNEGHTGVAIFMTLSGFLFAKLLDQKQISFVNFYWNRLLRLFPLLMLVCLIDYLIKISTNSSQDNYFIFLLNGLIFPTLPNGGWSITVELHFYLILPFILKYLHTKAFVLFIIILSFIGFRSFYFIIHNEVQSIAYWTILGRIDQFILGMLCFKYQRLIITKHKLVLTCIASFLFAAWIFNILGGFYKMPSYPSSHSIWIILPTIEGVAYGIFIAWYDNFSKNMTSLTARLFGKIGEYSYSIYLLHVFFVFYASNWFTNKFGPNISLEFALLGSVIFFVLLIPLAHLSYTFIETPFLKFRKKYILTS